MNLLYQITYNQLSVLVPNIQILVNPCRLPLSSIAIVLFKTINIKRTFLTALLNNSVYYDT